MVVIGLSVAFVLVSFLVVVTKGNPKWVQKKLRLGAMLLALTWAASGCGGVGDRDDSGPGPMCYDPVQPPNSFYLGEHVGQHAYPGQTLDVDFSTSNIVYGSIFNCQGETFSYLLLDAENQEIQKDDILPQDGAYDSYSEDFEIVLEPDLSNGTYALLLFDTTKEEQAGLGEKFTLNVTND